MTILKHIVSFNIPVRELECCQCKGTGKFKTQKTNGATVSFSIGVGAMWFFSFMNVVSMTPNYYISLPLFIISTIFGVMLLVEYKQQKLGEAKQHNENRIHSNS